VLGDLRGREPVAVVERGNWRQQRDAEPRELELSRPALAQETP
jgi:hypothetical protein